MRCSRGLVRRLPRRRGFATAAVEPQRLYDELKYKVGYMGNCNHKEVTIKDIYGLLQAASTPTHYKLGLQAVNMFYNFGLRLQHRELASRLVAAAMVCKQESEAAELIKLYGTWLERPPEKSIVYAVMGHFLDAGEPLVVRELAKAVREDWRMPLEAPLYLLSIEAMLRLPEEPLTEALLLLRDAQAMGVLLPARLHLRLLDRSLEAFEAANEAAAEEGEEQAEGAGKAAQEGLGHLEAALEVCQALRQDGHLRGDSGSATLCSLAWLQWHLAALDDGLRKRLAAGPGGDVMTFLGGSWQRCLEAALQNFGSHWGFSSQLPAGLFRALERSESAEAQRLLPLARQRLGRFYPAATE